MPNRIDNPSHPASVRDSRQGWEWTVLPASTDEPMVACGITSLEAVSRLCVEDVMTRVPDAIQGFLEHPGGHVEVCRRTRDGALKWMPLFGGTGR